ncbi:unnamed protein product [Paramecium sonneborni]|uniref:Uncharacterized protein n=1 Tax=Paramecium sonneborni TaxID=65129 RepID=A0A8S1RVM3_9CILI|nr:unnamed protein product [Paramecium sonneborni]
MKRIVLLNIFVNYGKKVLKEQQLVLKSSQNPVDLIINLNHFESELVMDSEKTMKEYQTIYTSNIERKQALKQKIFLSKYQLQNVGEELTIVTKEKEFSEKIYEERKKFLTEENKFVPQMQAIRNDEVDKLQTLKKEINQTSKSLTNFNNNFKVQLISQQKIQIQNDELNKFKLMCNDIRNELDTVVIDNPYTLVLFSLKPLLAPENAHLIEEVPQLLKTLNLALESSSEEIEAVSNERQELFNIEKNELKKDVDKRSAEYNQIKQIFERSSVDLDKLTNQQADLKKKIAQLQTEQEQLQSDMEGQQREYRNKLKNNLANLVLIRKIKQIYFIINLINNIIRIINMDQQYCDKVQVNLLNGYFKQQMEIIQTDNNSKQLIGGIYNKDELIIAQWGGNVIFKRKNQMDVKINTFCVGLLRISDDKYLCFTSKNQLLQINEDRKIEQIDQQDSLYFVCNFYLKTCLFIHNTIQQQRFLCLWNMLTQQKSKYEHISSITSVMAADDGIWFGDKDGYLNFITYKLKLQKRVKIFQNQISKIQIINKKIYCTSQNQLKLFFSDQVILISTFDSEISCIGAFKNKLILGTTNGQLMIQENQKNFAKHQIHASSITSFSINDTQIVTTSCDRTAKIIQLRTE